MPAKKKAATRTTKPVEPDRQAEVPSLVVGDGVRVAIGDVVTYYDSLNGEPRSARVSAINEEAGDANVALAVFSRAGGSAYHCSSSFYGEGHGNWKEKR